MNNPKSQPANVKVVCRFRPFNKQELETGNDHPLQNILSDRHLVIKDPNKGDDLTFVYDKIFNTDATQQQIYNEVAAPILENILDGFNGTIIAYGQTSSGKTYTIQGCAHDPVNKGIIPRIIQKLFVAIENSPACIEYKLKVSILELYMEKLFDLIDSQKTDLKIRESKTEGNYVEGKTEAYISDKFQLMRLMNLAQKNRITCVTNMNANSSRSHLIFHLTLNQFNSETEQAKVSNLFIVDLAGSEKVSKTGAEGKVLEQAKKINLSLTCLAKVIKSLSQKIQHVPYRDSKLTRIIQDSLGGNSKTTLVLTCSPHQGNTSQTLSTLRFGQTAQKIKNKPKINREPTIKQLQHIITKLESQIKMKDHHILMLETHIRNKYNLNLPKNQEIRKYEAQLKQSKMLESMDLNSINPTLTNTEQELNMLSFDMDSNISKYLLSSSLNEDHDYRMPELETKIDLDHVPLISQRMQGYDERISSLENELTVCRNSFILETSKLAALKKQYDELKESMKVVVEENINCKIKQVQLEDLLKSLTKNGNTTKQFFNKDQAKVINPEQIGLNAIKPADNENWEGENQPQLARVKQQNQILMKFCEDAKVEKELLQTKVKKKQQKIVQLKSMLEQIQYQMEQMAEEYEEPVNLNTKIANPINRAILCE